MIRIESLYLSPVKSLALAEVGSAFLDKPGISGDRAFFIVDAQSKLFTQREHGPLVQVHAAYDVASGALDLTFPGGHTVRGTPGLGDATKTAFWEGRPVEGHAVLGEWSEALSEFAGQELRLIKTERPGASFDGYPISMCSTASLQALADAAGSDNIDGRRFRQNIYLSGATPHEEDSWLDGEVRLGKAVLRVKARDSRCAVTTHSPETGEIDMNTLKIIASYRTDQPKEVNFGVYCTIAEPGQVTVGDELVPLNV
ncbi:MAG: MOSC N-terminal beta barrel domain-containing protein [Dehalococcoidia bacterium]